MTARQPFHSAGDPVTSIDTPALVVDLSRLKTNIAKMAAYARSKNIALRPHFKTHKCLAIAHLQIEAGAVGLCCQKVSEAEILVAGGIRNVLVTNEIFAPAKLERLVRLSKTARIGLCVDSVAGTDNLILACRKACSPIDVYIELDVGTERCGVETPEEVLELARRIAANTHMRLAGLQAYYGRAQHIRAAAERADAIGQAVFRVQQVISLLSAHGFAIKVITGGGTGSFPLEAASGVYTEIQPGSYVFMDRDYGINEPASDAPEFYQSLFILTSVHSRREGRAVIDAGHKSHTIDCGMPEVWGRPGLVYERPSDEHGSIISINGEKLPELGEGLWLIPGHCDPTVNLYDWLIAVDQEKIVQVWPIEARGAIS